METNVKITRFLKNAPAVGALRVSNGLHQLADRSAVRGRKNRGVTMIEYVLLIAIVILLGYILRDQLTTIFKSISSRLDFF